MKMRVLGPLLVALGTAASGAARADGDFQPVRGTVSYVMEFAAGKERTTAAFGPLSEAKWSPGFEPRFAYPRPAAQVAGAVFTTPDGAFWLLHDFDPAAGLVQYVVLEPGALAVTLTIRVEAAAGRSSATLTYDMVALDAAGAAHVDEVRRHSKAMAAHMQSAVGAFLAGGSDDGGALEH
jgi:hypothetical protein